MGGGAATAIENPLFSTKELRMKIRVGAVLALLVVFGAAKVSGQEKRKQLPMVHMSGLLGLVETIPLPTEGWMDHLAVDLKNNHLFISGEYSKNFVVVDLHSGQVIHTVTGLGGNPRKPFFDSKLNEVWVD